MRCAIAFLLAATLLLPVTRHAPDPSDESLRLYAVKIVQMRSQSWAGYAIAVGQALTAGYGIDPGPGHITGHGIYLGQGLVITAAHVVGSAERTEVSVRIANLQLPAKVIKAGALETQDLTLLAVEQEKLPVSLQLRRMPLCQAPPWPGKPVIVAVPEGIAPSTIMSPRSLPANVRTRFPTLISDVATTGNSGSGVFDAEHNCLLGIISRKIFIRQNDANGVAQQRDIAKYFVPAATIAAFIPSEYR